MCSHNQNYIFLPNHDLFRVANIILIKQIYLKDAFHNRNHTFLPRVC